MNIVVIHGSPSGSRGTSAQYIAYLQQQFPEHRFEGLEVARQIHKLERNEAYFATVVDKMVAADAIIWCYPVYVMLVSAQLKRFIELLFERLDPDALADKISTAISTSAHFYDHT
ncbi:MAG: NAD(P)H-dependent oxidoreductase, partial [Deltaproteobacteria bacterium]|nr:NAD(P)H-dependent oxidoreductase [Deltaproteobacteria bacterium]